MFIWTPTKQNCQTEHYFKAIEFAIMKITVNTFIFPRPILPYVQRYTLLIVLHFQRTWKHIFLQIMAKLYCFFQMKESVFRRMKDKSPTKKPKWACLCFHIFSVIDTQDLSVTVVPLTKSHFYVKNMKITPSVSKHWTDSQCTYDGQYCAYSPFSTQRLFSLLTGYSLV